MVIVKGKKQPLRIGIRLEPPAIVCIYLESNKLRMRVMPLRNVWPKTDTNFVIDELQNRHGKYLHTVPRDMIRKMIDIIKEHKQGINLKDILKKYESKINGEIKAIELNKDSKNQTSRVQQKKKTNATLLKYNRKEPLRKSSFETNSDDEEQFETKRNGEIKNIHDKFLFSHNEKSSFALAKNNSNSHSDELNKADENHLYDLNTDSDDDIQNKKFPESLNKKKPLKDNLCNNELTEWKNLKELKSEGKRHTKNEIKEELVKKTDNKTKNSSLKELLDVHNKIGSIEKLNAIKSEDDTDVEFDDSDIPLEEDFY